jgi:BirA family biotin operon repressor/biotin-[acetyl-CoA-carboxylase] ligase
MGLDIDRLCAALKDEHFYRQWIYREEVGSTMDTAREEAERGAPEGTIVIAGRQMGGRGRRGRAWESPEGGLWFSLLLRPSFELCQSGCIAVLLAVAAAQALRERYALPVLVKWPNDLLLHQKKLGGILVELVSVGKRIDWLIAGMGINVNNPLPQEARTSPISLRQALGHPVELEDCLAVILRDIARTYRQFLRAGFEPIHQRWSEFSALSAGVLVHRGENRFDAQVRGLSELGRLIIERAGRIEELVADEVTLNLKG